MDYINEKLKGNKELIKRIKGQIENAMERKEEEEKSKRLKNKFEETYKTFNGIKEFVDDLHKIVSKFKEGTFGGFTDISVNESCFIINDYDGWNAYFSLEDVDKRQGGISYHSAIKRFKRYLTNFDKFHKEMLNELNAAKELCNQHKKFSYLDDVKDDDDDYC
jgi:hypothetical protein